MLILIKLLTIYVIRIYALGSVSQRRSKVEIPGLARQKERLSRSKLKQAFL